MKKIQIIGNVTRDAEVRQVSGSRSVVNFDVAVNTRWRDKATGEKKERVSYVKCAIWRENTSISQYITKGTKVYVEGDPDVDCYVNKEGKAVGSVKINVREIEFLGGGKNQQQQQPAASTRQEESYQDSNFGNETLVPTPNDDLPF